MFQMEPFLHSSSVGRQGVSESSKEKLSIQDIVETLCPRLYEGKVILQEIISSLTRGRCWKEMTQALAERAVEVASNISQLLEGAEETPQLLDNISQLEQTLREIYVFVQSETQRNPLLSAKDLCVRYHSLDRQLRGLLKPFEQTVKKRLVLCGSSTIQEDHPGVGSQQDGAVAEIVTPNNTSAIHASGSMFHNANNFVVYDGNFYAAHNLVVKKIQDYDRTPQGIVEGADVYTPGDVPPKQDIYKGRGYRIYSAYSTAKGRAVKIKLYEGSSAKDRCLASASFSQKVMHPNVLHLIGVSPLNSELPFLVFDESTEWAMESIIASALIKGLKQSLLLGLQTVAGLSSGLDYLHTLSYPFASVGLDHFVVGSSHGNIVISFDPEVLADETRERDRPSGVSDGGNELYIFHGLCQKTFDAASKAHYEFQKVQRSDLDELDSDDDHDLDQDRFEEIEADAGTLDTKGSISDVLSALISISWISSRRPTRKSNPTVHRRELVWRSEKNETVSLEEIALRFQRFLLTFPTELGFNRRRGRYTTKTAHRCPGYNRIEITLTPDIARSAIVSHLTPIPHEICPVCKEIVKDAEIFACICGRDDNESISTIRCSTCSEWHHRPCVSISENEDQNFACQRCKVRTKLKLNKRDSFGHFEVVSDEEKDIIDILPRDSSYIMEPKVILEPKPGVPRYVYNPIIDFAVDDDDDDDDIDDIANLASTKSRSSSLDDFFGIEWRFSSLNPGKTSMSSVGDTAPATAAIWGSMSGRGGGGMPVTATKARWEILRQHVLSGRARLSSSPIQNQTLSQGSLRKATGDTSMSSMGDAAGASTATDWGSMSGKGGGVPLTATRARWGILRQHVLSGRVHSSSPLQNQTLSQGSLPKATGETSTSSMAGAAAATADWGSMSGSMSGRGGGVPLTATRARWEVLRQHVLSGRVHPSSPLQNQTLSQESLPKATSEISISSMAGAAAAAADWGSMSGRGGGRVPSTATRARWETLRQHVLSGRLGVPPSSPLQKQTLSQGSLRKATGETSTSGMGGAAAATAADWGSMSGRGEGLGGVPLTATRTRWEILRQHVLSGRVHLSSALQKKTLSGIATGAFREFSTPRPFCLSRRR